MKVGSSLGEREGSLVGDDRREIREFNLCGHSSQKERSMDEGGWPGWIRSEVVRITCHERYEARLGFSFACFHDSGYVISFHLFGLMSERC